MIEQLVDRLVLGRVLAVHCRCEANRGLGASGGLLECLMYSCQSALGINKSNIGAECMG